MHGDKFAESFAPFVETAKQVRRWRWLVLSLADLVLRSDPWPLSGVWRLVWSRQRVADVEGEFTEARGWFEKLSKSFGSKRPKLKDAPETFHMLHSFVKGVSVRLVALHATLPVGRGASPTRCAHVYTLACAAQVGIQDARSRREQEAKNAARKARNVQSSSGSTSSRARAVAGGGSGGVVDNTHRRLQAMTAEEQLANSRGRGKPKSKPRGAKAAGARACDCLARQRLLDSRCVCLPFSYRRQNSHLVGATTCTCPFIVRAGGAGGAFNAELMAAMRARGRR